SSRRRDRPLGGNRQRPRFGCRPGSQRGTTGVSRGAMSDAIADRTAVYVERVRQLAPLIHAHAEDAERTAQLPAAVPPAFTPARLFRMFPPVARGGGALTVPATLRVIEEVARLDGSAGWNLAICSGGPLFGHCIAREAFDAIFSDPRAVVAGSLNPTTTRV